MLVESVVLLSLVKKDFSRVQKEECRSVQLSHRRMNPTMDPFVECGVYACEGSIVNVIEVEPPLP